MKRDEISRRTFVGCVAGAAVARVMKAEKPRLPRKDCFFGLHFDLHPNEKDRDLGRDLTADMIRGVLRACKPDFVQYDSKGHPGYLGFSSKTGMSAPGIVNDSLAMWRKVTAEEGVALYNHFSGVLDGLAVQKHPEWARVGPDGERDAQETSTFSAYERELMIPELEEVAQKYDLDGSWVDGDCWAVKPDYCDESARLFRTKTGIAELPKGPTDRGWNEFLELQREQFRQYVARYVDALHRARRGYQITSNWMYSTFAPEKPELPLDYLSGDIADEAPIRRARIEARYFAACGKPWDLMSWGFETDSHLGNASAKPAVGLEQEAATVMAQGGAYQIYYVPTRAGWIDDRVVKTAAQVGAFCRKRQKWAHRSESIPEVGVLFSGRTLYRTGTRVFGGWGTAARPGEGALEALLACGYSVDMVPDWKLEDGAAEYPLLVVPDWKEIGQQAADAVSKYVDGGGRLLLFGAANVELFAPTLGLKLAGSRRNKDLLVADETGFASISGEWVELQAGGSEVMDRAYREPDTRKDSLPLAVRVSHGNGTVVICGGPLASAYGEERSPLIRGVIRRLAIALHEPVVNLGDEFPEVEVVLRRKNGQPVVHLANSAGAPVSGEFRHWGVVPVAGPMRLSLRMKGAPKRVVLEPEGREVQGSYEGGAWHASVPALQVHSMLRIEGGAL